MIDPTIWADEDFGSLTMPAKVLFIGLFSNADDEGRIRANESYLKSTVFMYDITFSLVNIKSFRDEVVERMKSVRLYKVDGKQYIQLNNWSEYQKQHKDRIVPSTFPPYEDDVTDNVGQVTDNVGVDKVSIDKVRLSKDRLDKISLADESAGESPELNSLIGLFKNVNPNYERLFENKTQRDSLNRQVKKFTFIKIKNLLTQLPEIISRPYSPQITTPLQLESKMGDLIQFLNKEKNKADVPRIAVMK